MDGAYQNCKRWSILNQTRLFRSDKISNGQFAEPGAINFEYLKFNEQECQHSRKLEPLAAIVRRPKPWETHLILTSTKVDLVTSVSLLLLNFAKTNR